jgi:hypothetical protein
MIPASALLPVLLFAGVPWTRDYGRAATDAEEKARPLLYFFRGECGGGNRPQNPIEVGGPIEHQEGLSPCDRMQEDVWEDSSVAAGVARFVPVLVESGDQTLQVRYQVIRTPTTLVTDPWGNEVLRVSGYFDREKMLKLLAAVPADFGAVATASKALRARPTDFAALVSMAEFYQAARLPQVVERLYGLALNTPRSATPVDTWRRAVIARGLNLLVGLANPGAAAGVFDAEAAAGPDEAGTDALLLGSVNARLQQGKRKEAEATVRELEKRFPKSQYTQRARENLDGKR